ncbi:C40 family peptidase [Methylobrevis pamukkalensis]|uniref:Gamma-D-glutamyl-L-lysine endopeptidase n=1 Tax=Methylobrevis pamukkalensis TaxID=1439726 RepID=A0A1E3H7T8_9HYPH|nr:NlpC/P60 family protein [Methylobrevis pamukkalensis]ODN72383.1 Gamma-D-glutamyl-L-lysine endopeptidase [Methylobrevis pamukkalensis]
MEGTARRIVAPVVDLRPEPRSDKGIDTQMVRGEPFTVYDVNAEGWAWGQAEIDGYVGWLPAEALGPADPAPTHRVAVASTFVYPGPDMKLPRGDLLPLGAALAVIGTRRVRDLDYGILPDGGAVVLTHLETVGAPPQPDFVAVATGLAGTPYLWGGRTAFGLDCSGLVQLALARAGVPAPRDSDMQASGLGEAVEPGDLAALRRGDLLHWKGHIAIAEGNGRMVHANGHHMLTVSEPLQAGVARIAAAGVPLAGVRRIPGAPIGQ